MLLLDKLRVLIATLLFSSQTQAKSVCSPHILEDVAEYGTSVEVENMNFNELISQLLKLVEAAEFSYFEKIRANFILAKERVCSESGKGLSLKTAKWLQKNGVNAKIYLSLKWVNGELLVYDNQSSNALFLHGHEITALLERHLYTSNVISSLLSAANFKRLYGNLRISNDLQQLTSILQNAGVDQLLQKLSDALLKKTPVCRITKGRCVVHSYLTQSTNNNSVNLHEISRGLVRSTSALITCIPQLGESGLQIPSLNRKQFLLKEEILVNGNETISVKLLENATYLSTRMRDLNESEITLSHFLIYSKEDSGKEKFQLLCLNTTIFKLDGSLRKCTQHELISLPPADWTISNDLGSFSHFEHHFHLQNLHLINSLWDKLSDILRVPEYSVADTNVQNVEDSENFTWVTADGIIRNETHFVFYGLVGTLFLITLLVCCFHEYIRRICQCLLPKRRFQPKVHYEREGEQVVINPQEMKSMACVYDNHSVTQVPGLKSGSKLKPGLTGIASKKTAPQPILGCDGAPSDTTSAPTAEGSTSKTTSAQLESGDLPAPAKKKLAFKFDFPVKKGKVKN